MKDVSHFWIGGIALTLLLAACGQQGPLYLPNDEPRDIVTRPTQTPPQPPEANDASEAPNSPQTVDSPVGATPAPEVTAPETDETSKKDGKNGATPPPR